ncbi:uncharacterized protein LOC131875141 [Cryptomeria japonica]|uniref:uncharacterized protein LOC131875141 n=1 Tax=Cryptomeria japonica TaxID=3369 RepID=UPI0027DAAB7C|nr:uncharacterized protein LOC131875141 [Cryptomeria japonica]
MSFGGYKMFPRREDGSSSGDGFENLEENPFYNLNIKDNKGGHDETLTVEEQEKLRLERDIIQIPKSNKVEEEKGRGKESTITTRRYSPPHLRNLEQPFRVYNNPLSDVVDNNYEKKDKWKNIPYNENRNQYNYGQYNNHNDERRTNSGEIVGDWNGRDRINNASNNRGNYGNNGNYGHNGNGNDQNRNNNNGGGNNGNNGNNGGNRNYQANNYGGRPPMTIERYKHLDFSEMVGYPNQISNDLRSAITKFIGNGTDFAK